MYISVNLRISTYVTYVYNLLNEHIQSSRFVSYKMIDCGIWKKRNKMSFVIYYDFRFDDKQIISAEVRNES